MTENLPALSEVVATALRQKEPVLDMPCQIKGTAANVSILIENGVRVIKVSTW